MFKKATKLLSTMVIVAGTVVGNFSPTLALAEGVVKAGDTEGMTNTVKVKDDSLADCKRILEGQAAFPVQAGETEPVDLVVVEDASGSFSDNFPHVRQAIDEVVQGLSDQDRVMLTSYRGGKQFMFPDGKVKINSADYDMNVRVDTQLTHDKSQFVSGFGDVRTYGGTPTASGLKLALDTYNQTHGDLTNRKTYFLLVTDGVANTRLDGYLHKTNTNDSINEYPDPRHPFQVSVEYSNDYQGAAAEVLALNQEITNQGYEMINAYWESVESLSSVNSYFDKYKTEVGPFVKQELQQGSSTPEDFITSQSIDDFTTQLKQIVKDRLAQSTPATASLTIANQFDIQSATATDEELAPYIEQGGIPNQADLNFGNEGDVLHSNKPTVTPPPVDPNITKDVEGQEHLDLTNRDQEFKWNVKTAFGNETSTWTQASMVDDINKVLDITDVKVTDENGKDVTANGKVTQENNKVTFEMNKQADSYDYLSGHTYTMTITTKIKASATDEELAPYIEQGGIPNQADLNFGNEGDVLHSNKPTVTPPAPTPEDPTITKDIEGQEHLDLTNRDQEFKWNVKTAFGNETSTWTQASMVDDINKVLDITDVKVTDENGKDVTANGKVTQENNKVTFEMNKQADSYDYLSGHTYTMTITTKIKADATDEELAPYIEQGGIPNQADLNFGNEGDVLHSNKPTVTPPAPTPEDPTITKDIENQEHLDLTNREDSFDWHVKTAFGNETSTWQQASLVDDINQLLDIQKVVVTDENGKDVTANGKVTQENNKVTFTMNKKDDSYDYLSGHTYTMTITTKIKADATDEELAPYIQQGGIPNQVDLNFGNEGDVLHSNKPTVTPPAPTPEDPTITKDIEGQEHLDLTNRNQAFKWNVKTAFGNETSTWTQASMVDDINKVLDITDVKVTDENGKDVTDNGIVTQENNKVTFTMNKKDDSYSYLAGHTYTMTITTKIKTDATDEELAPYIEQGGIPNQADLNFGNEGDVLHSNKPTVTPPAPTPEDPKKPEPKQPLKPKKPLTPTNHQAPTNPVNFGKSASKGIHLPMTNTTVNPLYMIAGLIVLIVAISFGITKNKKRKN
ncbi:isopeptide-forming domain-containing fimbrial protein [Enterococcus faecalis]|nr:isopeptide-forming domain-containing fimbrial protein [Enterococcus faecalis]